MWHSGGRFLRAEERDKALTLRLSELALLNTGLDGLVELGVERALGREGNLVVRSDILLDSLATVRGKSN